MPPESRKKAAKVLQRRDQCREAERSFLLWARQINFILSSVDGEMSREMGLTKQMEQSSQWQAADSFKPLFYWLWGNSTFGKSNCVVLYLTCVTKRSTWPPGQDVDKNVQYGKDGKGDRWRDEDVRKRPQIFIDWNEAIVDAKGAQDATQHSLDTTNRITMR